MIQKHRLFAIFAASIAFSATAKAQVAIYQEDTAGEVLTVADGDLIHDFDNPIRTGLDHTLTSGSDIEMSIGHHLVLYNTRFDSTGGNERSEMLGKLNLNSVDLPVGWSQSYMRRQGGNDEMINSGGAIINVENLGDILQLRSVRSDTNTTQDVARVGGANAIQLIKLDDSWGYIRLVGGTGSQALTGNGAWDEVTYDTELEKDPGFTFTPGTSDITLDDGGHYLVMANTYLEMTPNGNRDGCVQKITLDNDDVPASSTTSYIRGEANSDGTFTGVTTTGMIIEATAGQVLNIEVQQKSGQDINITQDKTAISIVKLPDFVDYIRLEDLLNKQNINPPTLTALNYDDAGSQLEVDSAFSHSVTTDSSRINVNLAGDYLFLSTQFVEPEDKDRAFYNQGWRINGTGGMLGYGQTGNYARNSGVEATGNWSGIVTALNPGDYIETVSVQLGNTGNLFGVLSLQGIKIDTLFGPDSDPPEIAELSPPDEDTDVYIGTALTASFNELIDFTGAGTVTVSDGSDIRTIQLDGVTPDDGNASITDNVLTITLDNNLNSGSSYEVTISGGAIQDEASTPNIYPGTSPGDWNFTTATLDGTAPIITSTDPADNTTGVPITAALVATFDDQLVLGTGDIRIREVVSGTTVQTISVTDSSQVSLSGNVLTITPATVLPVNKEVAIQIDAGAVINLSDIDFAGLLNDTDWSFTTSSDVLHVASTGDNGVDTWTDPASWDPQVVPVGPGPWSVTIGSGNEAHANAAVASPVGAWSGTLLMDTNSQLKIFGDATNINSLPDSSGAITMASGAWLRFREGQTRTINNPITLTGNAQIRAGESTGGSVDLAFDGAITGNFSLDLSGNGGSDIRFGAANTFNGITMSQVSSNSWDQGMIIYGDASGSLGVGNIDIIDSRSLVINAADSMADTATLTLAGPNGDAASKLVMNANDTIGSLIINGFNYPAGTYGASGSGANYEVSWINGTGILTVANATNPGAPTVTFDAIGEGGSTTDVLATEPVTYTITFSHPVTSAPTAGDFENTAGTGYTIESIAPVANPVSEPNTYTVVVKATESGSLNLGFNSGAVFTDLFGNTVSVPTSDNDTLNVSALTVVGQYGIWKPWSNGGINPNTGQPWAAGDTYRIAATTVQRNSNTPRADSSSDISVFNQWVNDEADAYGAGNIPTITWYLLGSTPTVDARDNTFTNPNNTGHADGPVVLLDGLSMVASSKADLWDGNINVPIGISFDGTPPSSNEIGTGTAPDGTGSSTGTFGDGDPNGDNKMGTGYADQTDNKWTSGFSRDYRERHYYAMSEVLTVQSAAPPSPYDQWASDNGLSGADADPTADTENGGVGDGLTQLEEFAFGTDPNATDNTALTVTDGTTFTPGTPTVEQVFDGGNPVNLRYVRRKDRETAGITYTPRFSDSLDQFQPDPNDPVPTVISDASGDYEVVEVPFPLFDSNGLKAASLFGQVVISSN